MKTRTLGMATFAACLAMMLCTTAAQGAQEAPTPRCVSATLKTVKKGNSSAKPERWFTARLHRVGCLKRANPRPRFRPFSQHCRRKAANLDGYVSRLTQGFTVRLESLMLQNQSRLLQLDSREISLLRQRRKLERKMRNSGAGRRKRLAKRVRRVNDRLLTVRTKRARINYSMNRRAITRRGAAGLWLSMFDGEVNGCSRAFSHSPYQVSMRGSLALLLAANQFVTPQPTRARLRPWNDILNLEGRL